MIVDIVIGGGDGDIFSITKTALMTMVLTSSKNSGDNRR